MKLILYFFLYSLTALSQETVKDSLNQHFIAEFCSSENKREIEKPLHLDWIGIDIENIKSLNELYQKTTSVDDIIQILPNFLDGKCNCNSATYDCGYNLKSTNYEMYGGYGQCFVSALYFDDQLIRLRFSIDNDTEIANKYLLPQIKFPLTCINGKVSNEIIFQKNIESYKAKYYSDDSNTKRSTAINYFTDNLEGSTFETPYYILFGLGAETFNFLRYFIVNKDYDAMEGLIYSPSPTSRLLAAKTISYMQKQYKYKPAKEHQQRIKEIIAEAKPIKSGIVSCWMNKFDYDYYDVNKNFESYLLTQ